MIRIKYVRDDGRPCDYTSTVDSTDALPETMFHILEYYGGGPLTAVDRDTGEAYLRMGYEWLEPEE